jgi:isocitrate lyase
MRQYILIFAAAPLLSGCIVGTVAKTAVDVATIPVKVASAGVDAVTTSQKEADEKRGQEARKQDEERGKQIRLAMERCRSGKPLPTDQCPAAVPR